MRALVRDLVAGLNAKSLTKTGVVAAVVLVLGLVVLPQVPSSRTVSGQWEISLPYLVLGGIIGLTYGLLSVGLVLVYRSNRLINFAHGQIGVFGAAVFAVAVTNWQVPYWIAFIPALLVGAGAAAVSEAVVVRRLRNAPAVMSVVATLGIGQFLVLFAAAINSKASLAFPQPPLLPEFPVGALLVTPAYSGMLILSPLVVLALWLFLRGSIFGLAIRGAADNQESARMAGIYASRMSTYAWAIAGAIATLTAILTLPTQSFIGPDSFGPRLLLIALTGAVLARMQSLPVALLAGVGIGVSEQVMLLNVGEPGIVDVALFVVILVGMLAQRQAVGRAESKGSWTAVQPPRQLPTAIRNVRSYRLLGAVSLLVLLVGLILLPLALDNATSVKVTGIFGFIVIGLSVGLITGLGGQLSLGQFAFAAVGAVASIEIAARTGNYFLSFLYAGLVAAIVSAIVGLPALRAKGLLLTVTTLAFALAMPNYLLRRDFLLGLGLEPGQPILFGTALETGDTYYYVGLATVLFAMVFARNVRQTGLGRRLVAVRDNEDAARAFTIPATRVKLQGFALAGFLAGVGGAMFAHSLSLVTATDFGVNASIDVVKMAVIGGIGLFSGPILGAVFVLGVTFLPLDTAGLAATALGQLLVIMYLPTGLGAALLPARDRLANFLARRAGVDVEAAYAAERGFADNRANANETPPLKTGRRRRIVASRPLLEVRDLRKSFGGVRAVRGVSFDVMMGETLGLIGPNGAGKTTTFELLAGFTAVDEGRVAYSGRDVTRWSPEARGRLGLIRSFQDAALFPTLTVLECVTLSLERAEPTKLVPSLLGMPWADRRKEARAEELVRWMGLERYRSSQIQELSTGTRRITEIACLVALQPELLLLDEPSSGVAQKETEALAQLLVRLKDELDLTLIIIEHDIPMIMSLSDRIVCMADGEVIAHGTPAEVRSHPAVVEAYLGGSVTAIERSSAGTSENASHRSDERAAMVSGAGTVTVGADS